MTGLARKIDPSSRYSNVTPIRGDMPHTLPDTMIMDGEPDPLIEENEIEPENGDLEVLDRKPKMHHRIGHYMTKRDRSGQIRISDFHPYDITIVLVFILLVLLVK